MRVDLFACRVELLGIVVFFHVGIAGVDDGLGEVNHGVLLLPVADDLVLLLDACRQACCTRWPNHRVLPSVHRREGEVGAADEMGECSRTSDGPTAVVDENHVPHTYLGDGDPRVPVRR